MSNAKWKKKKVDKNCEKGVVFFSGVFDDKQVSFFDKDLFTPPAPMIGLGEGHGPLYYLPEEASHQSLSSVLTHIDQYLLDWHIIFNHIGLETLELTLKALGIKPNLHNEIEVQQCSTCVQSKMSLLSFASLLSHRAFKHGKTIHCDVSSFESSSREGFSMWVTFIDNFSKDITVYPLKLKSQTFQSFRYFRAAFEKKNMCSILSLVLDNCGGYIGSKFQNHLCEEGIMKNPVPSHCPQLHGVAERANFTLFDRLSCCMLGAKVPKSFWADALHQILFSMNSIPCQTPSEGSVHKSWNHFILQSIRLHQYNLRWKVFVCSHLDVGETAPWLTDNFKLQSIVLSLKKTHDPRTGANLCTHAINSLANFRIVDKLYCVSADNASHNITMG